MYAPLGRWEPKTQNDKNEDESLGIGERKRKRSRNHLGRFGKMQGILSILVFAFAMMSSRTGGILVEAAVKVPNKLLSGTLQQFPFHEEFVSILVSHMSLCIS